MYKKLFKYRLTGLILCLIFTLIAYFLIIHKTPWAILTISILSILQFTAQFIFFIDIWREEGPPWNMAVFVSTLSIILVILLGSIWIMYHLNKNMMP